MMIMKQTLTRRKLRCSITTLLRASTPLYHLCVQRTATTVSLIQSSWMIDLACTEEEVCFLLKNTNASKATGPDDISARMLKETASAIVPSLTILFNCSISQRCFPACWKLANVVPIPKSISQKTSPNGYRPISLLPI